MVDTNFGMTIIPELTTHHLNSSQQKRIRSFKSPEPVREISLITHREFLKAKLVQCLKDCILSVIPDEMKHKKNLNIVEI